MPKTKSGFPWMAQTRNCQDIPNIPTLFPQHSIKINSKAKTPQANLQNFQNPRVFKRKTKKKLALIFLNLVYIQVYYIKYYCTISYFT